MQPFPGKTCYTSRKLLTLAFHFNSFFLGAGTIFHSLIVLYAMGGKKPSGVAVHAKYLRTSSVHHLQGRERVGSQTRWLPRRLTRHSLLIDPCLSSWFAALSPLTTYVAPLTGSRLTRESRALNREEESWAW